MKQVTFKLGTIVLTIFLSACSTLPINKEKEIIHVVLLSGQSNMFGGGLYKNLSEQEKLRVYKASLSVSFADQGRPAKPLSFRVSEHHLNYYGGLESFGPELFLGTTLAENNPNKRFLLIKTAVGGTSLYGAWNPDWNQGKANLSEKTDEKRKMKLFYDHIERTKEQLTLLKRQGKDYKLFGIAWFQGEQDSVRLKTAAEYEDNLNKLISAYRYHLNSINLPFVIGQINNPPKIYVNGPSMVRSAMEKVADSQTDVDIIKTKAEAPWSDYPKHQDNVHYNAEGQRKLGTEFAKRLEKLNDMF